MGQSLKKHPGGRPTKYNKAILTKTMEYMDTYQDNEQVVPTISGLAQYLNLARDTVNQWLNEEDKKEFSYMCKCLLTSQETKLVNGGLTSGLNSNVVKLMLSKHGYTDNDNKQGVSVNIIINDKAIEVKGETYEND